MANVLVGDHDFDGEAIATGNLEVAAIDRRDQLFPAPGRGPAANRKDVDAELVILKEFCDCIQLLRPFVVGWNRRI